MDTQDRLIIYRNNGQRSIPIQYIEENDILFTFNEFEYIGLSLLCSSEYHIEMEYPNSNELKVLRGHESIVLNDYDYYRPTIENNIFVPETYYIGIFYKNEKINCYFKVKSNALGDHIDDIRRIVNDYSHILQTALYKKGSMSDVWMYDISLYQQLKAFQTELMMHCHFIFQQASLEERKSKRLRSSDIHRMQKKGYDQLFDDRSVLKHHDNIQTEENHALKACLMELMRISYTLKQHIHLMMYENQNQLNHNRQRTQVVIEMKERMDPHHDERYKNKIHNEYQALNEQMMILYHQQEQYQTAQETLSVLISQLRHDLYTTWLSNIEEYRNMKQVHAYHPHYQEIFDFVHRLHAHQSKIPSIFVNKKTSELYEIYVMILLFDMLLSQGYQLDSPYVIDFENLAAMHEYRFVKENQHMIIRYDQFIKNIEEQPKDELVNQNSTSNKPDIVFMSYEQGILKHCVIIEVKCRKKEYIYLNSGDTPVFSQLKDYTNFWYCDHETKIHRNAIDKVYAIYPQKENGIIKEEVNASMICLLALKPVYDFHQDESYLAFKKELIQYM